MQILTITVGLTDIYYNVQLYVLSTWGFDYTNVTYALQQGAGIHYLQGGHDSHSISVGPCELIVCTNVGPFSTMDGFLLRMVNELLQRGAFYIL